MNRLIDHTPFESALIDETAADGSSWDALGGTPDAYVSYKFDDVTGYTSTDQDTLSPAWHESVDVQLSQTQTIVMEVRDEDMSDDDTIAQIELTQIPVSALKAGGLVSDDFNAYLLEFVLSIDPK